MPKYNNHVQQGASEASLPACNILNIFSADRLMHDQAVNYTCGIINFVYSATEHESK